MTQVLRVKLNSADTKSTAKWHRYWECS